MKLSRFLILAATLLSGSAALGAEAEKSGRAGAAYDSYYLVKHRPGHQFALCTTRGKILTQEYDYLEAIGKDIGKGTGLWWAMPNGDGSLTQILRDDGTPYVKERFLSSASFFRNEKGVAVLDSGEMLVPGLGDSGQYFYTHIVYPEGFVQKLGKGASPTSGTRPYTTIQNSNGKVSLYDISARKAVPDFEFDEIRLNHGHVCIVSENGKWGVSDMRGNLLVPIEYDLADWHYHCVFGSQDIVSIELDGKGGLFDAERGWLVKPEDGFTVHDVSRQAVAVSKNGKYELRPLGKGRPLLTADKRIRLLYGKEGVDLDFWGIAADNSPTIDYSSVVGISRGKVVKRFQNVTEVSPRYANGDFSKILFFVVKASDHASGVLSSDGLRFLYPVTRDAIIWNFGNHIWILNSQTRLHYVQTLDGKVLLDWKDGVTDLERWSDASGYFRIVRDGKAGLVDGDCRFVLPCDYEDAGHFGEGLVPAKQDGKWGFVTLDGKWPIPAVFDEARSFKRGCAPVRKDGKWGFIDKSGKAATPFAYDDVKDVRDGHFRAKVGEKWGLFAIDGTCRLPAEYDDMLADGEPGYGDP